jgi:hypothetical protein
MKIKNEKLKGKNNKLKQHCLTFLFALGGKEAAVSNALAGVFAKQKLQLLLLAWTLIAIIACSSPSGGGGQTLTPYIITGSGTDFTATYNGAMVAGAENQPIQTVIDAIKADTTGEDCAIQFGSGGIALSIGTNYISFNNSGGNSWGKITLLGSISSSNTSATAGTIVLADTVSIDSKADVANSANGGRAINNTGTGTVNITAGTVSSIGANGIAINNQSTGVIAVSGTALVTSASNSTTAGTITLNNDGTDTAARLIVSGGTVKNTSSGKAIFNGSRGAVHISGGTVEANTGQAIYDYNRGKITISGAALVTSANTNYTASGTIYMDSFDFSSDKNDILLEISGGTVKNTAANGNAIFNDKPNVITISGGIVEASGGAQSSAIYNNSLGTVNISGGTVKGANGVAIYNRDEGRINISGTALVTSARGTGMGTIHLMDPGTVYVGDSRLVISGGTVSNTSSGSAVYNDTTRDTTVSGGTVINTGTGSAIYHNKTGQVRINGGTVSAVSGNAIYNGSTGEVIVNGGTITSASGSALTDGTIYCYSNSVKVTVTSGTVSNTGSGDAIKSNGNNTTISGGLAKATAGMAVNASYITISGGTAFAYGTSIGGSDVVRLSNLTPTGNGLIIWWNNNANASPYTRNTNTDIKNFHAVGTTPTIVWDIDNGAHGIRYTNGANTGFIPIEGVTVQ